MAEAETLSDLYDMMTTDLPGITQPLMLQYLQRGAREFLRRSSTWQVQLDPHNLIASEDEYTLDWGPCAEIKTILEVRQNSAAGVTAGNKGGLIPSSGYELTDTETLKFRSGFIPQASVTNGLDVKVVFVPDLRTCEIPKALLNEWAEGIVGFAVWRLKMMKGKKWTDREGAGMHRFDFKNAINRGLSDNRYEKKNGMVSMTA